MLGNRLGGGELRRGDEAVRDTNDDAQLSKLSCVRHGYFQDAFVHHFVRRPARRSPLINRGYYSRYAALRSLLLQFLALGLSKGSGNGRGGVGRGGGGGPPAPQQAAQQRTSQRAMSQQPEQQQQQQGEQHCEQRQQAGQEQALQEGNKGGQQLQEKQGTAGQSQRRREEQQQHRESPTSEEQLCSPPSAKRQVLVLGAGYDTTFFQLAAEGVRADKYIELDFLQVTQKKAVAILHTPDLLACIGGEQAASSINPEEGRVWTKGYCLLPADLRELSQLQAALETAGLDPSAPTYVLSECVLVYLQPQHSREVVRWLAEHLQCAAMVIYEQIQPHDAFGQQMLINLESRGCPLLGIEATPSLEAQKRRFTDCGWQRAEAHTMDHVYRHCIDPQDRRRIERLEIFDEFEEWHLIQQHYCISIGIKDDSTLFHRFGLPHFAPQALPPAVQQRRQHPPPPPRFMAA